MQHVRPSRVVSVAVLIASLGAAGAGTACGRAVNAPAQPLATVGRIVTVRSVAASPALNGAAGIEVVLTSARVFPAVNALATLMVGDVVVRRSWYPDGTLTTIAFTLSRAEFDRTVEGASVTVRYEPDSQGSWDFGAWRKALLDR